MRTILLIVGFVIGLASPALAAVGSSAVDTWYVRPTSACTYNGDGLSYACAASNGAAGAFKGFSNIIQTVTVGFDDGDTLYLCGTHATHIKLTVSAASEATRAKVNWNCPGDPGTLAYFTAITGATTPGNWTEESPNIWWLDMSSYTGGISPVRLKLDGVLQFAADSKAHLGPGAWTGNGPIATRYADGATSRLYLYASANPATLYTTFTGNQYIAVDECNEMAVCMFFQESFIDFIDPVISGGYAGLIFNQGGDHIRIYGTSTTVGAYTCVFSDYARGVIFTDSIGNGTGVAGHHNEVHHCSFDQGIPTSFANYWWAWSFGWGDAIDLHYGQHDTKLHDLTFKNCAHTCLEILANAGTSTVVDNEAYNLVFTSEAQHAYGRPWSIDGAALGRASRNKIYSWTATGFPTRAQYNGNGNFVFGFVQKNQKADVINTDRNEFVSFQGYAGVSRDNTLCFGTMYNNPYAPAIGFIGDTNATTGNVMCNLLIVDAGGTYKTGHENVAIDIPVSAFVGSNTYRNIWVYSSTGVTNPIFYKATGKTNVAGFQSACSGDTCDHNVSTNPLLISATDLRLQPSSTARRAGITGFDCADARGRLFCWPDVGGLQMTGNDPAPTRAVRP